MNPTQLRDTLAHHDANPDTVLTKLHTKQTARRRRQYALASGLTVIAIAAVASTTTVLNTRNEAPLAAPGPVKESAKEVAVTADAAEACFLLKDRIGQAAANGFSVITARSARTRKAGYDGYQYQEMKLTDIRTLAGPKVSNGATAWTLAPEQTATPAPGVIEIGPDGPLWGPDGALVGVYIPASKASPVGATIYHVPLVDNQAILTASGCWKSFSASGLTGTPYHGPLTEIPNSGTYQRLASQGFTAIPLTTIKDMT